MKLPTQIKVACFDIKIVDWHTKAANSAGNFGEFSPVEMEIRVDTSFQSNKTIDTFLHEINHAIYWAYGIEDEDKEERIVSTFATAWTQVFRDNPEVLKFINQSLK